MTSVVDFFQSFIPGFRLVDGGQLKRQVDLTLSTDYGVTALSGGGQTGATQLTGAFNILTTVATTADSVMLAVAVQGRYQFVINNGANSAQVFGQTYNPNTAAGDVIIAHGATTTTASTTGVAQASAVGSMYYCTTSGVWKQMNFS